MTRYTLTDQDVDTIMGAFARLCEATEVNDRQQRALHRVENVLKGEVDE